MLTWIFGPVKQSIVHHLEPIKAAGLLELERARVRWFLSLDGRDLPVECQKNGQRTYRSITVAGQEVEFSDGFTDLHTISYQEILKGEGFSLLDARTAIEVVYGIRNAKPMGWVGDYHPYLHRLGG